MCYFLHRILSNTTNRFDNLKVTLILWPPHTSYCDHPCTKFSLATVAKDLKFVFAFPEIISYFEKMRTAGASLMSVSYIKNCTVIIGYCQAIQLSITIWTGYNMGAKFKGQMSKLPYFYLYTSTSMDRYLSFEPITKTLWPSVQKF